jgi:hypothetical protein
MTGLGATAPDGAGSKSLASGLGGCAGAGATGATSGGAVAGREGVSGKAAACDGAGIGGEAGGGVTVIAAAGRTGVARLGVRLDRAVRVASAAVGGVK